MATIYRVTYKSEEQRGASQLNTIELAFASDSDALAFGHNGEIILEAHLVSVTKLIASNYSLPYPVGTDGMTRTAITDGHGHWQNVRIYDTPASFNPVTRAAALIASGFEIVAPDESLFWTPTSANIQVFNPGVSI